MDEEDKVGGQDVQVAQAAPAPSDKSGFRPIKIAPEAPQIPGTVQFFPVKEETGILSNVPGGTPTEQAVAKGAATATLKGLSNIPGFGGGINDAITLMHAGIKSIFSDKTTSQEYQGLKEEQARVEKGMKEFEETSPLGRVLSYIRPGMPPSGEDIYKKAFLPYLGEYEPESGWGRLGMTGVEAGLSMLGPGSVSKFALSPSAAYIPKGPLKAPGLLEPGMKKAREAIEAVRSPGAPQLRAPSARAPLVPTVTVGTVGGLAGEGTQQLTDSTGAGLAAGFVIPTVGQIALGKVTAPYRRRIAARSAKPAGVEVAREQAGETLLSAAEEPKKVYADVHMQPTELVPGSAPSLGELTGDRGLIAEENRLRTKRPGMAQSLNQIADKQEEARKNFINNIAPAGVDKLAPRELLRHRLNTVDNLTDDAVEAARAHVEAQRGAIPLAAPLEETGENVRTILQHASDVARNLRTKLYKIIDPNNDFALVTSDVAKVGRDYVNSFDPRYDVQPGRAHPYYVSASKLSDVTRFNDLTRLEANISREIQQARIAGDVNAVRELGNLKSAIKDAIDNAIENQAAFERTQVAAGNMRPDQTLEKRLQQEAEQYLAAKTGKKMLPPSPSVPNIAEDIVERFEQAKRSHADFASNFREGPAGKILRPRAFANQYVMQNANVPSAAFPAGPSGYSTVSRLIESVGRFSPDNASALINNLQDIAIANLRKTMGGQPDLTQRMLDRWKTNYADALRALDEHIPGFSNQFNDVPSATRALQDATKYRAQALKEAQKGFVGRILGMTSPDELNPFMGRVLGADTAASKIGELVTMFRDDPDALNALRRSALEHIRDNYKGNKLAALLENKRDALGRLFTKEQMDNFGPLIADYERKAAYDAALRARVGPTTAQNLGPVLSELASKASAPRTTLMEQAALVLAAHTFAPTLSPLAWAQLGLSGGAKLLDKLAAAGVNNIEQLYSEAFLNTDLAKALMQEAVNAKGVRQAENMRFLEYQLGRLSQMTDVLHESARDERMMRSTRASGGRIERASGGRASIDHGAEADKLIALADKAKKAHNSTTEPLLDQPDEMITKALAIADKAI